MTAVYIVLGIVFGIVGGMGLGGGIVLIPALVLLIGQPQHAAQGMTLFAYLPMAASALFLHIRRKNVDIRAALFITAFGALGGVGGYLLASVARPDVLRRVFAVFMITAALLRVWRQEIGPRRQCKQGANWR